MTSLVSIEFSGQRRYSGSYLCPSSLIAFKFLPARLCSLLLTGQFFLFLFTLASQRYELDTWNAAPSVSASQRTP